MSFIRTLPLTRTTPLTTRLFTTTPLYQKTATETAKETLDSATRTISDAAAKGVEKGSTSLSLFPFPIPSTPFPVPFTYLLQTTNTQ